MILFKIVIFSCNIFISYGSYHWIVTESGRIETKLDSAFPVKRPYDFISVLEQEQRLSEVNDMHSRLLHYKSSVDQKWAAIELETDFEKRLYATDPNCMYADQPLSSYHLNPSFLDVPLPNRPKLPDDRLSENPPDCRRFHKLDFSMLTFPHLNTMRNHGNFTEPLEIDATESGTWDIDLTTMLLKNSSDWTAYNLAVHYWHVRHNASNAIECARRAVFFAPREWRYLVLFNLGTLLQAMNRLGEAAIVLHTAVDMDRGQYRTHVGLGHVYTLLSDYSRAAGCYQNALSLRPDLVILAKLRAAVLCHQRLFTGLWAIYAALKKILDELQDYNQLQERWMLTHTKISLEHAYGESASPPPYNLRTLWQLVKHQALLLSERMSQSKAMNRPSNFEERKPDWSYSKGELNPISSEESNAKCVMKGNTLRRKQGDFQAFMARMSARSGISPQNMKEAMVEKMNLEEHCESNQGSPHWEPLSSCVHVIDEELADECGQEIFSDYIAQLSDSSSVPAEPPDLLDESTIENYVHERTITTADHYHDLSEL